MEKNNVFLESFKLKYRQKTITNSWNLYCGTILSKPPEITHYYQLICLIGALLSDYYFCPSKDKRGGYKIFVGRRQEFVGLEKRFGGGAMGKQ